MFKVKKNPLYRDASKIARLLEEYAPEGDPDDKSQDKEAASQGADSHDGANCESDKNA